MINWRKLNWRTILLLILLMSIFGVILVARFWQVGEYFSFNFDEEYQAWLAWRLYQDFHLIWIGVSASNVKYYLGPGFTYLNFILFELSRGGLLILAYFSVLFGLLTMLSVGYITYRWFGLWSGIWASALYGGSAFLNYFDRRFWNPSPVPFIAIWLLYSLSQAMKQSWWFVLTAALVGISLHVHLSLVVLWPIIAIVIWIRRREIKLKHWLSMILIYLAITSPLIVFDINHKFDNFLAPVKYFQDPDRPSKLPSLWVFSNYANFWWNSFGRFWYLDYQSSIQEEQNLGPHGKMTRPFWGWTVFSLFLIGLFGWWHRFSSKGRLVMAAIMLYTVSFISYPGVVGEYYMLGMFVMLPVVFGTVLSRFNVTLVSIAVLVFVIINLLTVTSSTQAKYGLEVKKNIVEKINNQLKQRPYELVTVGADPRTYHPYGGWRYMFSQYGYTPSSSYADQFFGWLYPDQLNKSIPEVQVIIAEDMDYKTDLPIEYQVKEGAFQGLIIKLVK